MNVRIVATTRSRCSNDDRAGLARRHLVVLSDPWHKKRHHKRRLIQPPFVALLASRLAAAATLCTARPTGAYASRCSPFFRPTALVTPQRLRDAPGYAPLTSSSSCGSMRRGFTACADSRNSYK
jgi:tRNA (guanine-N7-)-methyltransferase